MKSKKASKKASKEEFVEDDDEDVVFAGGNAWVAQEDVYDDENKDEYHYTNTIVPPRC
jgi:hypothetical protein